MGIVAAVAYRLCYHVFYSECRFGYTKYMTDFNGSKAAIFVNGKILVILRDKKRGLPYADKWDLPGGGRKGSESPIECLQREVREELDIRLSLQSIIWKMQFPAPKDHEHNLFFMVAELPVEVVDKIKLGNEGQRWTFMNVDDYLADPDVVAPHKRYLQTYLDNKY